MGRHLRLFLPIHMDDPAVQINRSCNGLDQGGFAGAIFTQQSMDFAFYKVKRYAIQG